VRVDVGAGGGRGGGNGEVWGIGFGVWDVGFRAQGLGFGAFGSENGGDFGGGRSCGGWGFGAGSD
jgi:hypothetical protein